MLNRIARTRSIVVLMAVALSIYVASYLALRQMHMIVHFENVLIPGHVVESETHALNLVYYPLRAGEVTFYWIRDGAPDYSSACVSVKQFWPNIYMALLCQESAR